jgi:hypothetical protein
METNDGLGPRIRRLFDSIPPIATEEIASPYVTRQHRRRSHVAIATGAVVILVALVGLAAWGASGRDDERIDLASEPIAQGPTSPELEGSSLTAPEGTASPVGPTTIPDTTPSSAVPPSAPPPAVSSVPACDIAALERILSTVQEGSWLTRELPYAGHVDPSNCSVVVSSPPLLPVEDRALREIGGAHLLVRVEEPQLLSGR